MALMQALIAEIKVTSRQHIVPTFRVPTGRQARSWFAR
jgi:hypothetical protein